MVDESLSFMARLKRHHIFRVASGYAVVAYALILVANAVFPDAVDPGVWTVNRRS